MLNVLRWLRSIFISIPLILIGTATAATLGIATKLLLPGSSATDWIKRAWARWVLAAAFVHVTVEGREHLPSGSAALYCANHRSYLDPPALIVAIAQPLRFLAKESLFGIPFFGWAMRLEGDIPIDRENPRAAARSLERAADALRGGLSLIAFPEGTRSRDGNLQPFLSGAFRLAIRAQAPVIPIAIIGSGEALRRGSLLLRGGTIRVKIAAPVSVHTFTSKDQQALSQCVEQVISRILAEMRELDGGVPGEKLL